MPENQPAAVLFPHKEGWKANHPTPSLLLFAELRTPGTCPSGERLGRRPSETLQRGSLAPCTSGAPRTRASPPGRNVKMNGLLLPRQAGDSPCVRSGLEARPCLVCGRGDGKEASSSGTHTP